MAESSSTSIDPVPPAPLIAADLPSGDPIIPPAHNTTTNNNTNNNSKTPSSSVSSSLSAPIRALASAASAAPAATDAFLAHLNRCLSTPAGIDTVLLFACYTSRLAGSALDALSRSALRRSAREWIALVAALPPRTMVLFSQQTTAPASISSSSSSSSLLLSGGSVGSTGAGAVGAAALVLARRLKALSGLLSETRMILRLWALLGMYFWARGLVTKALKARRERKKQQSAAATVGQGEKQEDKGEKEESALQTAIAWTQLTTCVVFQALENGAYLSSRGVMGWSAATQARAFKWSARLFALYVGVELGRLAAEGAGAGGKKQSRDQTDRWRREVARNLAWAPLTIHWSTDRGFVSEMMVGLLGSIPGLIQIRDLWAETA